MAVPDQYLDRLRLRHLRLLELIDRHGSLRAVGAGLNLTQPAVSQMVKDLEYAFGAELVDRSVRGAVLTAAGRLALQRVRSGLATIDHLAGELRAERPMLLRLGTNPALMSRLLPDALSRLDPVAAQVRFTLSAGIVGDMMQALWDGSLDGYVGRVDWNDMPPGLAEVVRHHPLTRTKLVLVCSTAHPLAGREDLWARDLLDWPWALSPPDANNRVALEAALRNLGLRGLQPVIEVATDPNGMMELARRMTLLTCLPRIALDTLVPAGELCILEVPDLVLPPIQIGFVMLAEHAHLEVLQALRAALSDAAREADLG